MSKFFRRGQSSVWWVPTIASGTLAPTVAEITAGTPLGKAITGMTGFETSLNRVNVPVLDYAAEAQIDGPQTLGDASLTLLDDDGVTAADSTAITAAHTAVAEGSVGYVVINPRKRGTTATAGDKVLVFPAKVGAYNPEFTLDAQPARSTVQLAITSQPAKGTGQGIAVLS